MLFRLNSLGYDLFDASRIHKIYARIVNHERSRPRLAVVLVDDIEVKVAQVPNVDDVKVELVFEPMWNPEMMSEAARLQTGLY